MYTGPVVSSRPYNTSTGGPTLGVLLRKLLAILVAMLPFALAWSSPLLTWAGFGSGPGWAAGSGALRVVGWACLALGGLIALLNLHLSFGRPALHRLRRGSPEGYQHRSGCPLLAAPLLALAPFPLYPDLWPSVAATLLLLADTGGPLWFVVAVWGDRSFWEGSQPDSATGRDQPPASPEAGA